MEARVSGSQPEPYHVRISLDENGELVNAYCDCPYDWSEYCKHLVAVGVAYEQDPGSFKTRKTVEEQLSGRSREELLELVQMMINHEPSLKYLLDHPIPGRSSPDQNLGDPDKYRQEVNELLNRFKGPGSESELARNLLNLEDRVEAYIEHENYGEAYALLRACIEEILRVDEYIHGGGSIAETIHNGVEYAVTILEAFKESDQQRATVIDFLYSLYEWDVNWGGFGLGDRLVESILEHSSREDRDRLREEVRKSIRNIDDGPHGWSKERFGEFLLELHEQDHNVDAFLEDAEALGLPRLRAECLLKTEKVQQACKVVRNEVDGVRNRLNFANGLLEKGYSDKAGELVEDLADENDDDRLMQWLSEYEEEYGQIEKALSIELERFRNQPSYQRYERVFGLAEQLDRLESVDRKLMDVLQQHEASKALARVHLRKSNWDQAWEYVEQQRGKSRREYVQLGEEVARKTAEKRPARAIGFYRERARRLIDRRGRDNYEAAADYLLKIRELYDQNDLEDGWEECVREFFEYASNLPACRDEFEKAGVKKQTDESSRL